MKLWLLIGLLSYLSYAVSTSIDKYMMNRERDAIATNTVKSFLDGAILLTIGLLLGTRFPANIIPYSLALGSLYAASGIIYFRLLQKMNVESAIPVRQSSNILLIFMLSAVLLSETVNQFNILGAVLSSASAFIILQQEKLELNKYRKGIHLLAASIILSVIYGLAAKILLNDFPAITLAASMYFSATLFQLIYQVQQNRIKKLKKIAENGQIKNISLAALFGASGTFLLYTALKIGNASEVYPLAGAQSAFIFIFATLFLNEEFTWKRALGLATAVIGIYLIQI